MTNDDLNFALKHNVKTINLPMYLELSLLLGETDKVLNLAECEQCEGLSQILGTKSSYTCWRRVGPERENCLKELLPTSCPNSSVFLCPHHLCSTVQHPVHNSLPHHQLLHSPNIHCHTPYPRVFRGDKTPVSSYTYLLQFIAK